MGGANYFQSDTANDLRLRSQLNMIYGIGDYHVWLNKAQSTGYMRITSAGNVGGLAQLVWRELRFKLLSFDSVAPSHS